jgi:hypothetical protein
MKRENPTWGAPRIHGELLALGFEISEPTVSRYLQTPEAHSGGKQSQPVARLSEQRSRGDSRIRLFHRANALVSHLILLLRD